MSTGLIRHSATDRTTILAALQLAVDRVAAEQDVCRQLIDSLPVPTEATALEQIGRICGMSEHGILAYFDGYHYPSTWMDRDRLGIRTDWQSDPYCVSTRCSEQVADRDIQFRLYHLNELAEQRDRIELLARVQEFMGGRLDDLEAALGRCSHIAECLRFVFLAVFRLKLFEGLAGQARELGRQDDLFRFTKLSEVAAEFLRMTPMLLSGQSDWPTRLAQIIENVSTDAFGPSTMVSS